jgi:DNA primase
VLPANEDPDSYVRGHSIEELRALFDVADDLPGFLVRAAGKPVEALSAEQKDGLVREAAALLAHHPSADVRDSHMRALRAMLGLKEMARAAPQRNRQAAKPISADDNLGLFVPDAKLAVRSEDKPEWQYLQLLLFYPELCAASAEVLNLDWFQDDRVRELADYALALLAEGRGLSLMELNDRLPESLRDALAAVDTSEGEDPEQIRRKLAQLQDGLEMKHLKREKLGTRDLATGIEIQKRIQALERRKVQAG